MRRQYEVNSAGRSDVLLWKICFKTNITTIQPLDIHNENNYVTNSNKTLFLLGLEVKATKEAEAGGLPQAPGQQGLLSKFQFGQSYRVSYCLPQNQGTKDLEGNI